MTVEGSGSASPQRIAASPHGMVSTASPYATDAAVGVLEDGGNAMDAAVHGFAHDRHFDPGWPSACASPRRAGSAGRP